jgi:hypothetical protein
MNHQCEQEVKCLDHEGRVRLANDLTNMLLEKYGKEILLGGIYGSTSRGTDVEYSDLELLFIVKNDCKAATFNFAFKSMPVEVCVQKMVEVEKEIKTIALDWPQKMGRLFNLKITCGDPTILKKMKKMWDNISEKEINEFLVDHTPLCYEGLGKLKAVKIRGNNHEIGLFVYEILIEFTLLTAILNREFINYDYLGGLFESFNFKHLPRDYEKTARRLLRWNSLNIDETILLADQFVHNFVDFLAKKGIKAKENTPLAKLKI